MIQPLEGIHTVISNELVSAQGWIHLRTVELDWFFGKSERNQLYRENNSLPVLTKRGHGGLESACQRTKRAVLNAEHARAEPQRHLENCCTKGYTTRTYRRMAWATGLHPRLTWDWTHRTNRRSVTNWGWRSCRCDRLSFRYSSQGRRRTGRGHANRNGAHSGSAHYRAARRREPSPSGKHRGRSVQYHARDC